MKIVAAKDHNELSEIASKIIIEKVKCNPEVTLGFATGGTPVKTYELLVEDHRLNNTSYKNIKSVNLDEYVGLPSTHPQSYHYFMYNTLFKYLDINNENIQIPHGDAVDLLEECHKYDNILESLEYPDLQLLGIGGNGHIGFNEPGTSFSKQTYVTALTESTRCANARFFKEKEDVPSYAITMGIASILKSKEILLLASGESKAAAIKELLIGEIDERFPASALKLHDNVTIIADQSALKEVKNLIKSNNTVTNRVV